MTTLVHRKTQRLATELILMTIHHLRKHRRLRRTLLIQNTIRDKLLTRLSQKNRMPKFNRLVLLALLDQFRVRLEQTEHLFLVLNLFTVESTTGNGNDLLHPGKVFGKLSREDKSQIRTLHFQYSYNLFGFSDNFFCPRNNRVIIFFVTLFSIVAFRRGVLIDSEIERLDLTDMEAKAFQNGAQTGLAGILDDTVDGTITIVTQTGIGRPVDIRFNNGAVTTDVIGIDFFLGNHAHCEKSVERLPGFRREGKMSLIDELKTDGLFGIESAEVL